MVVPSISSNSAEVPAGMGTVAIFESPQQQRRHCGVEAAKRRAEHPEETTVLYSVDCWPLSTCLCHYLAAEILSWIKPQSWRAHMFKWRRCSPLPARRRTDSHSTETKGKYWYYRHLPVGRFIESPNLRFLTFKKQIHQYYCIELWFLFNWV